jgi:hypothetical protein
VTQRESAARKSLAGKPLRMSQMPSMSASGVHYSKGRVVRMTCPCLTDARLTVRTSHVAGDGPLLVWR